MERTDRIAIVLMSIRLAAREINLFTLETANGDDLPCFQPGAHIAVTLPIGLERQYSLLPTDRPNQYLIGVKRDDGGRGGSRWMHDQLRVGMTLSISKPKNNFPLIEEATNTVLNAGGIGITPIYSMAARLEALGRRFELHYSCRTRQDTAFYRELSSRLNVNIHIDDEQEGRLLPIARIISGAEGDAHFYCCGPSGMLAAFERAGVEAGVSPGNLHVEYFTQQHELAIQGGFVVRLARTARDLEIAEGQTILDALIAAGIDANYSCKEGICGTCETKVLEGVPDHCDSILSDAERSANKSMMICCSGAKTKRLVLDL